MGIKCEKCGHNKGDHDPEANDCCMILNCLCIGEPA